MRGEGRSLRRNYEWASEGQRRLGERAWSSQVDQRIEHEPGEEEVGAARGSGEIVGRGEEGDDEDGDDAQE